MENPGIEEKTIREQLQEQSEKYSFFIFDAVTSTNDEAKKIASETAYSEDIVVLADRQTKGRGRGLHVWESPAGAGLYLSLVKKTTLKRSRFPLLNLVVGIAAAEAVSEIAGVQVTLKWPNDLLLSKKKLGGILLESSGQQTASVILGIGINVHSRMQDFSTELQHRVTSLLLHTGKTFHRNTLVAILLKRLEVWFQTVETNPKKVVDTWKEWADSIGTNVRVLVDKQYINGIFRDLDANGFMIMETENGEHRTITSGELCC